MIDVHQAALGLALADHNYCLPTPEAETIREEKSKVMAAGNHEDLMWEETCLEFEPPNDEEDKPSISSLSPAHSVDSGFDTGMESFLADYLDGDLGTPFDLDMLLNSKDNSSESAIEDEKPVPNTTASSVVNKPSSSQPTTAEEDIGSEEKYRKNALAARENRKKKKEYVLGLEKEVTELKKENEFLKSNEGNLSGTVEKLQEEVNYLKNVLANQSMLSVLLNRIVTTPGMSLSTSFAVPNASNAEDDDDNEDGGSKRYPTRSARGKRPADGTASPLAKRSRRGGEGGVCLHVSQDKVSLEMCSHCSAKAQGSRNK